MAQVSGYSVGIATEHASNFQRALKGMVRYRPHLNPCRGSLSLRRKKIDGERQMQYADVVACIQVVRREGAKKGIGAEMVALFLTEIVRDTLPEGAPLDVIVKPAQSDPVPLGTPRDEQRSYAVVASDLLVTTEQILADGRVEFHEAVALSTKVSAVERQSSRLALATNKEAR